MDLVELVSAVGGTGLLTAGGRYAWTLVRGIKRLADDVRGGIDAVHRTETRTQRIDARQTAMMNLFERPIFMADLEGLFTAFNREFETMTGYTGLDLRGKGWHLAVHPEDRHAVIVEWTHAVKDQRIFVREVRFVHREGWIIETRVEAHPVRCDEGRVFGWQGVVNIVRGSQPHYLQVQEKSA